MYFLVMVGEIVFKILFNVLIDLILGDFFVIINLFVGMMMIWSVLVVGFVNCIFVVVFEKMNFVFLCGKWKSILLYFGW